MVYWMNVSMDLRMEHTPSEQGGGTWMRIGEKLHREFNERAQRLDMLIQGRVMYEIMESFWPGAANDLALPEFLREYGRIWTAAPKVLISNSRQKANHNTRIVGGADVMDQLATLRREAKGDIGVGGATIATQLLRNGLLDELLLFTHPVVLGSGRPLFDGNVGIVACDLAEQAIFPDGVTMHRYTIHQSA